MKYVYYDASSKEIRIISPVKELNCEYPYIEMDDGDIEDVFSGKINILDVIIEVNARTDTSGRVKIKQNSQRQWKSINDWLYLIPNVYEYNDEVLITQNIKDKKIKITLSPDSKEWLKSNQIYLQQKDIVFSACLGTDPHHVVWFKNIPSDELLSDIEFEYEGSDDIRFYTHRYFEIYRHEQLT
jgi:hypothetical protein